MKVALPGQKPKRGGQRSGGKPDGDGKRPEGQGKSGNGQRREGQGRPRGENQGDQPSLRDVKPPKQEELSAPAGNNRQGKPGKPEAADTSKEE